MVAMHDSASPQWSPIKWLTRGQVDVAPPGPARPSVPGVPGVQGMALPEAQARDAGPREPVSLSAEINTATHSLHTALNRLITSRLPLALPPHALDSSLYATGLVHFAHVFLTFESLWADLLRDYAASTSQPTSSPASDQGTASPPFSPLLSYLLVNPYDSPSLFTSTLGAPIPPSPQLAAFLQTLRPRGLIRSSRLKRDLEHLLALHPTDLEVLLARYPGDKVAHFCTHIRKSVNQKPWTLLSYAWCFYMAVFSGGRWIRGGLLRAPQDYWPASHDAVRLEHRGLAFWHFPGNLDGEDIKAEFKSRLAAAETLLSPDERVDIIEEAKNIFRLCATLVDELDAMVAAQHPTAETTSSTQLEQQVETVKSALLAPVLEQGVAQVQVAKPRDILTSFIWRPEVTGTMVAMGCLACVAFLTLQ
ncbi:heme oxygenase-like protein [Plenodomus tracheiphilus IPT5]|uniref:Heme oxygenase-like protein n=1 Tax=Plenodomus tracheiphilus IPT5 TaxID=1408161 RepID=A0A6A7ANS2_9PLEO|nr:heme oxygenase-like protein [Plenodomus tracheiphilus IPT5]